MAAPVTTDGTTFREDGNCSQPLAVSDRRHCRFEEERRMNGLIYLVGLIVVIMAVLSLLGLR